jgi:diaminohydroxyphosphoribosylaminopyrimidine deaminase/5-amino-6-(5-phosphoribosylamino)uracil reductase
LNDQAASDLRWLDAAARLATPFLGTTAENPTVGALVVDPVRQVLLGRGVTARGGRPHAEPQALAQAGQAASGATIYVTLEPCNHWGRTPPCAESVISAGIARVVIGLEDPDMRTAGSGIARLITAGVTVDLVDHPGSRRLHEGHISRKRRYRPFVTLKLAVSADGMIGRVGSPNLAITGAEARRWTHMQRALSDAVMIGAGTARIDDPLLTVRLPGLDDRRPLRVVLAGRSPLPRDLNLFRDTSDYPTVAITRTDSHVDLPEGAGAIGIDTTDGQPDLKRALEALARRGVGRVLVEGGALLAQSLLDAGFVDRLHLLQAPTIVGAGGVPAPGGAAFAERIAAFGFSEVDRRALGDDMLRTFEMGA